MSTAQAIAALVESLGLELRNVKELHVDYREVEVQYVERDEAGLVVLDSNGWPVEHTVTRRWKPEVSS